MRKRALRAPRRRGKALSQREGTAFAALSAGAADCGRGRAGLPFGRRLRRALGRGAGLSGRRAERRGQPRKSSRTPARTQKARAHPAADGQRRGRGNVGSRPRGGIPLAVPLPGYSHRQGSERISLRRPRGRGAISGAGGRESAGTAAAPLCRDLRRGADGGIPRLYRGAGKAPRAQNRL